MAAVYLLDVREYTARMSDRTLSLAERQWLKVLGTLNEAQARLFAAQRAIEIGRGGISKVAQLTGMSRPTIMKGIAEIEAPGELGRSEPGKIRRSGAGRRSLSTADAALMKALQDLVEETTSGDPMSLLKWTCKSTATLAQELTSQGFAISADTVGRYLQDMDYSLQLNVKSIERKQHPDRDAQFRYINKQVKSFQRTADPVISIDTKKKELVGAFRNGGRTWRKQGEPEKVLVHDFPDDSEGKAIPYGAYDIARNEALVNVGIAHDTAEFAIESIRRWWRMLGRRAYPNARRLLICADAGGSNGPRLRAWKIHLHALSKELALPVTVCHYPPGTSKWNKIEHRLFSFISMNWRGKPLVNFETVVNLIGATQTRTGLKVKAVLDEIDYEAGKKFSPKEVERLPLNRHDFHGDWNYTVEPTAAAGEL